MLQHATALDGSLELDAPASSSLEGVFGSWNVSPQRLRTTVIATMAMGVVVGALAFQPQSKKPTSANITRHHQTSPDIRRHHEKDIRMTSERSRRHHKPQSREVWSMDPLLTIFKYRMYLIKLPRNCFGIRRTPNSFTMVTMLHL